MGAGAGYQAQNLGIINFELIRHFFPSWAVLPFLFMIISGLLSTVDSNLCAVSSLTTDIAGNGGASDRRHSDCKYPGNNGYTPVFVLWNIESIHTVANSTDIERSSPDIQRNNRRSDYFIGCRASCIRLRQRFE